MCDSRASSAVALVCCSLKCLAIHASRHFPASAHVQGLYVETLTQAAKTWDALLSSLSFFSL